MGWMGESVSPENEVVRTIAMAAESSFAAWASPPMRAIESMLEEIGNSGIPVLLTGEPGTGKEVVACRIHQLSPRRHHPLLKARSAALVGDELQSLLGEGAEGDGATGTMATLILDEVAELSSACQARLMQSAWLAGDGRTNGSRVRVISTTSQNLEEAQRAGRFADELYYQLSGVCLHLPPLRHRREDIPVLAQFFVAKYAGLFEQPSLSLGPESLRLLTDYHWPGNVRELEMVIRRLVALGDDRAVLAALGTAAGARPASGNGGTKPLKQVAREASRQAEKQLILKALAETRWNRKRAAQKLQISYKALLYKLKQIGLDDPAP
jgi:two-component system, NtrC family, response regulator AtoC